MQNYKNKFFPAAVLLAAVLLALPLKAQVTIGTKTPPQSFSVLELISENRGLRLPQLTAVERNALEASADFQNQKTGLAKGLTIFNKDTRCVNVWNGAAWIENCFQPHASLAAITEVTDAVPDCTGPIVNGGWTNDPAPTVKGKLDSALGTGETVVIYRSDNSGPAVKLPGVATVTGADWTYNDSGLQTDHTYTYTVKIVNAENVESVISNQWTIRVDTVRPTQIVAIVSYTDAQMNQVGDFDFTVPTNDRMPVINGTIDKPLSANETLVLYRADGAGSAVRIATVSVGSDLKWSYKETTNLAEGAHTYTARVEDAACNYGDMALVTLTIDTIAPNRPTIDVVSDAVDDYLSLLGPIAQNGYCNDPKPLMRGGDASPNGKVYIYDNGILIGSTTALSNGNWDTGGNLIYLVDGLKSLTITTEDAAGNRSAQSNPYVFTQLVAPPTTRATITGYSANGVGNFGSGTTTNNPTPTLQGSITDRNGKWSSLRTGDQIRIATVPLNNLIGYATVIASTWKFQIPNQILNNTTVSYMVSVMDGAGNLGVLSDPFTITVVY